MIRFALPCFLFLVLPGCAGPEASESTSTGADEGAVTPDSPVSPESDPDLVTPVAEEPVEPTPSPEPIDDDVVSHTFVVTFDDDALDVDVFPAERLLEAVMERTQAGLTVADCVNVLSAMASLEVDQSESFEFDVTAYGTTSRLRITASRGEQLLLTLSHHDLLVRALKLAATPMYGSSFSVPEKELGPYLLWLADHVGIAHIPARLGVVFEGGVVFGEGPQFLRVTLEEPEEVFIFGGSDEGDALDSGVEEPPIETTPTMGVELFSTSEELIEFLDFDSYEARDR